VTLASSQESNNTSITEEKITFNSEGLRLGMRDREIPAHINEIYIKKIPHNLKPDRNIIPTLRLVRTVPLIPFNVSYGSL
jgi:hypothetical protein